MNFMAPNPRVRKLPKATDNPCVFVRVCVQPKEIDNPCAFVCVCVCRINNNIIY